MIYVVLGLKGGNEPYVMMVTQDKEFALDIFNSRGVILETWFNNELVEEKFDSKFRC